MMAFFRTRSLFPITAVAGFFLALPFLVQAQAISLEVGIGAQSQVQEPYLGVYLVAVYQFIVGAIGIVAAVMIMFNGMRWVTAAGNSENISTAKGGISSAIVGLLIALLSYVLLNAINPALVSFNALEQQKIEFVQPVTQDPKAIESGNIADDSTLVHYMDELPPELLPYLRNTASEPYITERTYAGLVAALRTLANPSSPYYGMRLVVSAANRNMDKQEHFWACYQKYPPCDKNHTTNCGQTCPANCQSPGKKGCSVAAKPGKSRHGYGTALDASWEPIGSNAPYVANNAYIGTDFQTNCMVKNNSAFAGCTADVKKSIIGYNTLMQAAGFERICIEWWHVQLPTPGFSDAICAPGKYTN